MALNKLQRIFLAFAVVICFLLLGQFLIPRLYYWTSNRSALSRNLPPGPLYKDKERPEHLRHLLNLANFNYTLQPTPIHRATLGLLLVHSEASNVHLRSIHRKAIPTARLDRLHMRRIFVIATPPPYSTNNITQKILNEEQAAYGDLLQGNFVDAYRKLVYKHVMALRWATTAHSGGPANYVKFIVKTDDDTAYDVARLRELLNDLLHSEHSMSDAFVAGEVRTQIHERDFVTVSKWYGSRSDYDLVHVMPSYVSGSLYVTNLLTAQRLVQRAQDERNDILWLDDIWIMGVLRASLGIELIGLNSWYSPRAEYTRCCVLNMRRWHLSSPFVIGANVDGQTIADFAYHMEWCQVNPHACEELTPGKTLRMECSDKLEMPKSVEL